MTLYQYSIIHLLSAKYKIQNEAVDDVRYSNIDALLDVRACMLCILLLSHPASLVLCALRRMIIMYCDMDGSEHMQLVVCDPLEIETQEAPHQQYCECIRADLWLCEISAMCGQCLQLVTASSD